MDTLFNNCHRSVCWGDGNFQQHGHAVKNIINLSQSLHLPLKACNGSYFFSLSCGASHSMALTVDNEVYSWGNGNYGQLGHGKEESHFGPLKVLFNFDDSKTNNKYQGQEFIVKIACGARHSCFVSNMGRLYFCGCNAFPVRHGLNSSRESECSRLNHSIPKLISCSKIIKNVACGHYHTVVLTSEGEIGGFGRNNYGQLGLESLEFTERPIFLTNFESQIIFVAAGANHSLVINDSGETFIWGYGYACGFAQCHIFQPFPTSLTQFDAIQISNGNENSPRSTKCKLLAGGCSHSLFLSETGSVFALGSNEWGQLGFGQSSMKFCSKPQALSRDCFDSAVIKLDCGEDYSCALTEMGSVYMWGKNCRVIDSSADISQTFFTPIRVLDGSILCEEAVVDVSCGSWHAALVIRAGQHLETRPRDKLDNTEYSVATTKGCDININEYPNRESLNSFSTQPDEYNSDRETSLERTLTSTECLTTPNPSRAVIKFPVEAKWISSADEQLSTQNVSPERMDRPTIPKVSLQCDSIMAAPVSPKYNCFPDYSSAEEVISNHLPSIHHSNSISTTAKSTQQITTPSDRRKKLSAELPSTFKRLPGCTEKSSNGHLYNKEPSSLESFSTDGFKEKSFKSLKISFKKSINNHKEATGYELNYRPLTVQTIEFPQTIIPNKSSQNRGMFMTKRLPKIVNVTIRRHSNV